MKYLKMNNKHAIVIGSGVGGLTIANLLSQRYEKVTVFEAAASFGGKLNECYVNDCRFDKGPSLFTLPHLLDDLFTRLEENPREYFNYHQLPVITKYFFPDGEIVNAYSDLEQFKSVLVKQLGENEKAVHNFFKHIQEKYDFTYPLFLEHPIAEFWKYLKFPYISAIRQSLQLGAFHSLAEDNKKRFANWKTQYIFNRFATYNGSNPYKAPATLNVIPHLEHNLGAFFVDGGMRKIAEALYQLAVKKGVEFKFNTKIEEIIVKQKKAIGIKDGEGESVYADTIVSNMDVTSAYKSILSKQKIAKRYIDQEKSSSAIVFYWDIDKTHEQLDVHNILFSADYQKEFEYIAKGELWKDPTIYIYISSKANPSDAPKGHENWFTMINVPYDSGQDWNELVNETKNRILSKIKKDLGIDLKLHIKGEKILQPKLIEKDTSSWGGALYGNSSNSMLSAFLRHPHDNKSIKNLFFVGGSVHPGGGIPLCVLSANIAYEKISQQI